MVPIKSNYLVEVVSGPTAPGPTSDRRRDRGFVLMLAAATAMMVGASAPSPFYPVIQAELGFTPAMTTAVFAVYALALLAALLVVGSASDHLGRRPVISVGFVLLAISVVVFWHAGSAVGFVGARFVQGVASGLLLAALSAVVVDLEPRTRPGSAPVWNAITPMVGLALGALVSGLVLDVARDHAGAGVFGGLTAVYLLLAGAVWVVPETARRQEGLLASLRPRVALPAEVRAVFVRSAPAVFAGWATGGLYLSLGSAIVATELGGATHLEQGLAVALLAGSGAAAGFALRHRTARTITLYGTTALAVGTVATLLALAAGSLPGYYVAVMIAGTGFGTAFFGVLRSITPLTRPDDRAEVFAAVFVVSYVAFGVPAVVAGLLVPHLGLAATTYGYGAVIVVLATTAALLRRFGSRD